ncbi:carbon-nitrogen hydrolase [Podospora aff. communis PSN243]|uniref:Carbon-nitrogen hydrolase n=1 Tax=Podospora aff. communis PSN243 TaxID=3040156 RepID=A0AAV9GXH7_9PEZI|nr:carbon-nitrogen hydrolase [Podospora aff. communis PSN243]
MTVLVAVGQLTSTANVIHNLRQCQLLVKKAVRAGAKALFLPEASDYIASSSEEGATLVRPAQESAFVLGLQEEARREKLPIHVGVHEPGLDAGKTKNTVLWIEATGAITHRYQKVHLFDVEIKDGPVLKESNFVERGNEILPPFDTSVGKVGSAICFDLRFPEIGLALRRQGADIITFPSAFTVPTGKAHWETLLRARAIETQCYVIAAAQVGRHNEKRVSYGHSMVVDPWGAIVCELGSAEGEPEIATAEIDFELLQKVRREMPLARRTDVYPEV